MDPKKIKGVTDWSPPKTITEVRQFLGFTGYYQYFIPNYSKITSPLLELTRKTTSWHWDEPQLQTFETLKSLMCQKPVLLQPNFTKCFYLQTDASAYEVRRSEEHTSELQSPDHLVCRLLLEKKKKKRTRVKI